MKKTTISFVCQECGYDSPAYLGKCPECGTWNSLREFKVAQSSKLKAQSDNAKLKTSTPKTLGEIKSDEKERMGTGFSEMDGVFGGGIIPGSVTLLSGDPGIGKSTLLLQVALNIAGRLPHTANDARIALSKHATTSRSLSESRLSATQKNKDGSTSTFSSFADGQAPSSLLSENQRLDQRKSVLYISAEESEEQVKLRAMRLGIDPKNSLLLLSTTNTDAIVKHIEKIKPRLVIVDSIQAIESEYIDAFSGAVSQVRYATSQLVRTAKTTRIPTIIVGHVTKDGMVAGPMVLSHMVDTVLFLEGEKTTQSRILRSLKNRFGPVDEVGIFIMNEKGMEEASNNEQLFGAKNTEGLPGAVKTVILEGTRTFLVELQALVVFSKLPIPRRVASGIDSRRLELLLAVLQKHCRMPLDTMDVFVNVAGGIKVTDPAADVALCLALFSSFKNVGLAKTVGIAEIGLLGELRPVTMLKKRIKEAEKIGFKRIISTEKYGSIREVLSSLGR